MVSGAKQLQVVACPIGNPSELDRIVIATGGPSYDLGTFPGAWHTVERAPFLDKVLEFSPSGKKLCFSLVPNNSYYIYQGGQQLLFANGAAWQTTIPAPPPGGSPRTLAWDLVCRELPSISFESEFETCRVGVNKYAFAQPDEYLEVSSVVGEDNYSFPLCFGAFWDGETIVPLRFTIDIHRTYREYGNSILYGVSSHASRVKFVSEESVTLRGCGCNEELFYKFFCSLAKINTVRSRSVNLLNFGAGRRTLPRLVEVGPQYSGSNVWPSTFNYYFAEVSNYQPYQYRILSTDSTFSFLTSTVPRPVLAVDIQDSVTAAIGPTDFYFNDSYRLASVFYRGTPYQQAVMAIQLLYLTVREGIGYAISDCDVLGIRVNERIVGQDYGIFPDQENTATNPQKIVAIDNEVTDFGAECRFLVPA